MLRIVCETFNLILLTAKANLIEYLVAQIAMKALKNLGEIIVRGNTWKKLVDPTIGRGKTAWPKSQAELERIGVRFDYDGEVTEDSVVCHKYQ
jgi:hypothetical protein